MVLLIIIPMKNGYFIGGIPHFQTYTGQVKSVGTQNIWRGLGFGPQGKLRFVSRKESMINQGWPGFPLLKDPFYGDSQVLGIPVQQKTYQVSLKVWFNLKQPWFHGWKRTKSSS